MKTLTPRVPASSEQPHDALGRTVSGGDRHLDGDAELFQHVDRALHDRRVVLRTHQNQNL